GAAEGLLVAAALLERDRLPGVWAVWSGWDPEPVAGHSGHGASVCSAVSLALVRAQPHWQGSRLRISFPGPHFAVHAAGGNGRSGVFRARRAFSLEELLATLTLPEAARGQVAWQLPGGGMAEWAPAGAGTENGL